MLSSARIASSVATPIPLSAPSVVPLGFQPFPFNYGFYRVGEEVVLHIVVLFAHHVDVRLQHYGLTVLHTRCSGHF